MGGDSAGFRYTLSYMSKTIYLSIVVLVLFLSGLWHLSVPGWTERCVSRVTGIRLVGWTVLLDSLCGVDGLRGDAAVLSSKGDAKDTSSLAGVGPDLPVAGGCGSYVGSARLKQILTECLMRSRGPRRCAGERTERGTGEFDHLRCSCRVQGGISLSGFFPGMWRRG